MTWWMLRAGRRRRTTRRPSPPGPTSRAIVSGTDPLAPDDHRRRRRRRRSRSASDDVTAAVSPGQRRPRGAGPAAGAAARDIDRRAGGIVVEGRDIGSVVVARRAGEGLPHRRRRRPAPRAAPPRRAAPTSTATRGRRCCARDQIDSGRADRAAGDGRRRRPHRHHAVHPRRGDRPGRRPGRRGRRRTPREHAPLDDLPRRAATASAAPATGCCCTAPAAPAGAVAAGAGGDVRVHGAEQVPADGPGDPGGQPRRASLDGPLLAIFAPAAGARADQERDVRRAAPAVPARGRPDPAGPRSTPTRAR